MEKKEKYATILLEYNLSDYDIKSLYPFLPENIPEEEKKMYAERLLCKALQAGYIALKKESRKPINKLKAIFFKAFKSRKE